MHLNGCHFGGSKGQLDAALCSVCLHVPTLVTASTRNSSSLQHCCLLSVLPCSVYLFSLTENCLVDPASGFAGRSAGSHTSSATSSGAPGSSATSLSPREHGGTGLKPKHIPLTPYVTDASGSLVRSSGCNRSVAWWGPRVLAVAAADGSVSLVRLPESVNILGAAPIRFAAGESLCTVLQVTLQCTAKLFVSMVGLALVNPFLAEVHLQWTSAACCFAICVLCRFAGGGQLLRQ